MWDMGSWGADFWETTVLFCDSMSLKFLSQGYNRVNQKCFSLTFKKGPNARNSKYIYVRYSEDIKVKSRELRNSTDQPLMIWQGSIHSSWIHVISRWIWIPLLIRVYHNFMWDMESWGADFKETTILFWDSMSLEFLSQGYNRVTQKCFSLTLEKGPRKTKYIYVRSSVDTRVKS